MVIIDALDFVSTPSENVIIYVTNVVTTSLCIHLPHSLFDLLQVNEFKEHWTWNQVSQNGICVQCSREFSVSI